MLNLRKLKQDFSAQVLKEGRQLYEDNKVLSAKILHLDGHSLRISAQVLGQYKNAYETEIEINRLESETIDSNCDCPYHYDCQHLAAVLFYLEASLDEILVSYSKETNLEQMATSTGLDDEQKEKLLKAVKEAATKEEQRKGEEYEKEILTEYIDAAVLLAKSPFFLPFQEKKIEKAELAVIFSFPKKGEFKGIDFQLALRLTNRSKPLHIPVVSDFLEALRYEEPLFVGGKHYLFTLDSFHAHQKHIAGLIMDYAKVSEKAFSERAQKIAHIDWKVFGMLLAKAHEIGFEMLKEKGWSLGDEELPSLPCLYEDNLDAPIRFSKTPARVRVILEYIDPPASKVLLNPMLLIDDQTIVLEEAYFFECAEPGIIYNHIYYRFPKEFTRQHLRSLLPIRSMTIPEPLFGTLIENALPELSRFVDIAHQNVIDHITTLPYVGQTRAVCDLSFLNGELEAALFFCYEGYRVPAAARTLTFKDIASFITPEGIIARNLVEEQKMIEDIFRDFTVDQHHQTYIAKTEKKIIEFMTDTIPRHKHHVTFNCPQNLLDQFIYNKTHFKLILSHTERMDVYSITLEVQGALKGLQLDRLWDCVISKRAYLELEKGRRNKGKVKETTRFSKILVLDLTEIGRLIQLFDELGIEKLTNHTMQSPLWGLANIDETHFEGLPVECSMTKRLKEVRSQMLGETKLELSPIPQEIQADLRPYQQEGVHWLERLRLMYLNGILADDMGLGKTLQAIVAITQHLDREKAAALVVCPTSLLYNWKEECHKFNPKLKTLVIDGMPNQRKKLMSIIFSYDVIITSYSLLQKDIDSYHELSFSYMILDEAQHIKNRGTRNAKSVKKVKASHRMILSGTPIENSLEELWSLFDFLIPGFLGSYERFIEKYIRIDGEEQTRNLEYLKKKVAPFILRRMKNDVLDDLPPITENVYHCQLTEVQKELYYSYAKSARDELVKLVERDGFDKVQIHVLATLTRLKQICCHPAIFAKEKAERGDSAKYDMLLELLQTLIEAKHKCVIFSQYTRMLQIMRKDFENQGIRFLYLDGSSKNRLAIVNEFNADSSISIFLVSLKAGGTGLNLVGANTVIHYDMWWNPAVQMQATSRVYRKGQKQNVSVYNLVTLGTIEEKIVTMQGRKKGIVQKIVSCDDEAITKLTWEDVLELLQT